VRVSEIAGERGERGERVVYLGTIGGMGSVSLREAQSGAHAVPYDRYRVGLHHLAFSARSRATVDHRAAWLREQARRSRAGPRSATTRGAGKNAVTSRQPRRAGRRLSRLAWRCSAARASLLFEPAIGHLRDVAELVGLSWTRGRA